MANDRPKQRNRPARPPKKRNCKIYERHIIEGETQECVGAAFAVTQQRVGQIAAHVEAWIASHPEHPLAQRMRLRASRRWEVIWSRAIESFDRSREDKEVKKERVARQSGEDGPLTTVTECTVRQQNGDPRYLTIAARVAEREDRIWRQDEMAANQADGPARAPDEANGRGRPPHAVDGLGSPPPGVDGPAARFSSLPAGLCDLDHLACGLQGATNAPADEGKPAVPIATLFEQRCAEAFRYLGFEVRELGQGWGRVADCLAVAVVERFAVIIDAKVRTRGYALGTDDRQFCEYAMRHTRELALSGIEKVYFAVTGRGFRQDDLDKLAGMMTGTPIRSVCFIEATALMRLVNDSIARRREFRLEQLDRLLFGNKIIDERMCALPYLSQDGRR